MTRLGDYLAKRAINRAAVSRRTGISKTRLSELSNNHGTKLRADELYLIALAIEADPCEVLDYVCNHLKLEAVPR
ncbi:MAG: helix-turn-helix transcriptional regulator [Roseivirga sp.]|nr:helix-turn-helix transcriptional regulator [Roseivirga sp.]